MAGLEGQPDSIEIGGNTDIPFDDSSLPYFDVGDVDYSNLLQVEIGGMPLCVHLDNKSFAEVSQEVVDILADRLIERDENNHPTAWFGIGALKELGGDETPLTEEEQANDETLRKDAKDREKARFERDKKLANGAREWRESQKSKPTT